jgi:hypothetical protein
MCAKSNISMNFGPNRIVHKEGTIAGAGRQRTQKELEVILEGSMPLLAIAVTTTANIPTG